MLIDTTPHQVVVDESSFVALEVLAGNHEQTINAYVHDSIRWGVNLLQAADADPGARPIYIVFLGEADTASMFELPLGKQNEPSFVRPDVPSEFAAFEADFQADKHKQVLPLDPSYVLLTMLEAKDRNLQPGDLLNAFVTLYDDWLLAQRRALPVHLRDADGLYSELVYQD